MQAINYFLEPTRLQNTSYFWRFLDIIKSPTGKPLLDQLAASTDKLVRVQHILGLFSSMHLMSRCQTCIYADSINELRLEMLIAATLLTSHFWSVCIILFHLE